MRLAAVGQGQFACFLWSTEQVQALDTPCTPEQGCFRFLSVCFRRVACRIASDGSGFTVEPVALGCDSGSHSTDLLFGHHAQRQCTHLANVPPQSNRTLSTYGHSSTAMRARVTRWHGAVGWEAKCTGLRRFSPIATLQWQHLAALEAWRLLRVRGEARATAGVGNGRDSLGGRLDRLRAASPTVGRLLAYPRAVDAATGQPALLDATRQGMRGDTWQRHALRLGRLAGRVGQGMATYR